MKAAILQLIERRPRLLIFLLAALFLLPGTGELPLIDRDEPRFSHATVEMMERDNYFVPYFNDVYRFDKPPLTYWWMSLHYRALGITELGARLHSVIACYLTALVIFEFARRLLSSADQARRYAFLAAFAWLSCFQVMIHGRLALADMPLILGITAGHWAIWELIRSEPSPRRFNRWFWLLWLSIGMGFLAKGPLAFIPLGTLGLTALVTRQSLPAGRLQWLCGLPLALLPVIAWGLPANLMTDWAYSGVGLGEHVVKRGTSAFNARSFVPGFYFLTVFLSLLPWAPFLIKALKRPKSERDLDFWFLASAFLVPFAIFSFYATQLPHYILPGFPTLFILIARYLSQGEEAKGDRMNAWLWPLLLGLLGSCVCLLALLRLDSPAEFLPLVHTLLALGLLMLAYGSATWFLARRQWTAGVLSTLIVPICFGVASSQMRDCHATVRALPAFAQVDAETPRDIEWRSAGFSEGSIVWYSHRFLDSMPRKDIVDLALDAHPRIIQLRRWRVDDDTLPHLLRGHGEIPPTNDRREHYAELLKRFPEATRLQGFNPATSSWVELAILPAAKSSPAGP